MPRVGDKKWEVDWVSKLAFYEGTDEIDRDSCKHTYRFFSTKEKALECAKEVWPSTTTAFGIVEVTECEFMAYDEGDPPHVGYWNYISDSLIISDETGVPE
jgi:hypothetical protein